eukprot:1328261-Rhodomonas_salina.1
MVGLVITAEAAEQTLASLPEAAPNYLCRLRDGLAINAAAMGNRSRFLNHSCFPNAHLHPIL